MAAGGMIGRLGTADLRIPDPSVSEAHAMVSLRGRELHLLALRGPLRADGASSDDLLLSPGLRVHLAEVELLVRRVHVPDRVLALVDLDGTTRELCAPVYSLVGDELVDHFVDGADAQIWSSADGWWQRVGERRMPLRPQDRVGPFRVEWVPVHAVGSVATADRQPPLRLVVRTTTVHVHRPRAAPVLIDGIPGRIVSELALCGVPAPWETIAREVWPTVRERGQLRELWDRAMRRLRERLREAGLREDLVRADGHGNVELLRHPGDSVVDEG